MHRIKRLWEALRRLWSTRQRYVYMRDWLLSFYHRVLVRLPAVPLPGRYQIRRVWLSDTRHPFYVRLGTADWYVLEDIFLTKEYAPLLERCPNDVCSIVDLGANIGFSVRLWQLSYPQASLIAVEPDAENLKMCRRNALKTENNASLKLVQACVAGSSRPVSLDHSGGAWRFKIQEPDSAGEPSMQALTLPQILTAHEIAQPIDLLKCDIEGAEAEVFRDCSGWIRQVRHLVIELHHPYASEEFLADLERSGGQFELYYSEQRADTALLFLHQSTVQR